MKIFQNYHRHSMYTNIKVPDSVATNEQYAKQANIYGHGIISTMEHGHQGRYIEGYELAKKYNLKFLFGTEAYWVKDRKEKDNTNAHICIFAKNENGRQSINDVLAEANISGFYYQPRLDLELIFSLPKEDVWITTACLAFWKYKDDDIVKELSTYFGNNFFLEVQNHNTNTQANLNQHILDLSKLYNIPIIMGCDSHYIDNSQAWERDEYIKSKGIIYDDEEGWFLDYPDGDVAYQRFINQGVLSEEQIEEAIDNTNVFLTVEEYDNPCFNFEIKMPTLYPDLSQPEKDEIYIKLIWEKWNEKKYKIPKEKHELYEREIQKEIDAVITTKHADYFLIDYAIVQKGIENGGLITDSGRGSSISYYTNNLLEFTKIDRISSPVKMYPERFISPTRILESKSLADLDLNLANPEVFVLAQKEILGEESSYPMIAYGTMKAKSAWKMYARAKEIDFDLANIVSEQIEKYENALKHAEEDEKEDIQLTDFVDEQYHSLLEDSKHYLGIISDIKVHPCGQLLYEGDIRKEIGLIKTKSKTGKKEVLCTVMDGKWAEEYKFLKNDLLKVKVVEVIKKVYQRIEIEPHEEIELTKVCKDNQKVWDVYKNGWTMGINQVEQNGTKHRVMKYQPTNISELCAFVAAIRPGFKSMYNIFESRQLFSYNIPAFDNLIITPEMPSSFLLYQEMSMTALNFAGVPLSECYDVVKNIAKKREIKVKKYKDIFLKGFADKIAEVENKSEEEAIELANKVWQIISDSCRYQFNASHAYCVAIDSLYGAYLKSNYPLEFYEVFLNILDNKGEKDRIADAKKEAEIAYKIKFEPIKFRQDNRKFTADIENNVIWSTLKSIKGFGIKIAEQLYEMRACQFISFIDLLIYLEENQIMSNKIATLIKLKYFSEFGDNGKLLKIYQEFTEGKNKYDKKHTDKTKIKRIPELKKIELETEEFNLPIKEQIQIEFDMLGNPITTYNLPKYAMTLEIDLTHSPKLNIYGLKTGRMSTIKISKKIFNRNKINLGDIIYINKFINKPKSNFMGYNEEGKATYQPGTEKEIWVEEYNIKDLK